jgi:hypothetical protein
MTYYSYFKGYFGLEIQDNFALEENTLFLLLLPPCLI